ncbi:Protein of unknown function [Propionibacterium freudenreichii]|nr:Protein of unknown function [Propionibacterium freudenreichii subsp. freudenreichii]CEG87232.1 Protein of unknown function [Propionibacterium freudenreichii]CEG95344.1 Protein of unknown function [Propionibacterium freudenreichii]CEG99559.1 Protein of unknown function [Propionibacterium freudenreichii]CEI27968.1 Protein of unknown function [Propionibacterium freudenreichii]
MAAPVPTS